MCKPRDCEDNQIFVMFSADGNRAWGLLLKDQKIERFFGNPDEEKKIALRAAMHN